MDAIDALCTRCGLCCDGTLFSWVRVRPEELEGAGRHGLPLVERRGGQALSVPCPALGGTRCRIYAERPGACRGFDCLLLVALRDGEVDLAGALSTVGEARRRAAALPVPFPEARREQGAQPLVRVELRALEDFLDLRFRGRGRRADQ